MARKNGKTSLIAMIVLALVVGPVSVRNGQVYSAAQSRDQASLVFNLAAKMVRMSNDLNEFVTVRDTAKELYCPRTGVKYKALSADATTAYGLSPFAVIHDELGQVRGPRSELYDALETAMGAQDAPLSIIISTQAPSDADLLSVLIDDAQAAYDPRTILFMHAADKDDDPHDEDTWRKANPALGDFRSLEDMREASERAKRMPAFEAAFRNLFLNQRVAAENHLFSPDVWRSNGEPPDLAAFEDYPVAGGLDLSSRHDLTSFVMVARDGAGIVHVRPQFFAPAEGVRDRSIRDKVPYDLWASQGFLTLTPGRTVDYAWVANHIASVSKECDLRRIRFDRWRIDDLKRELERIGCKIDLEPHGQGFKDMSPAVDEMEALALNGQLRHGMNPILTWCASNVVITKDAAGNRKMDKSRATGRIDGMVALAMAITAAGQSVPAQPEYQMLIFEARG
jgi:phage terminase large subunit-like protein